MNNLSHHGVGFDRERDRDIEEQRARALQQHQQHEEMAHREREQREQREQSERLQRDQYAPPSQQQQQPGPAHHSSAGSLPIHQPVASRIPGAIHSPNGLLANHGAGAGGAPPPPPGGQMGGGSQGPLGAYGGPHPQPSMHGPMELNRQPPQQQPPQQPQMYSMMQHGGSSVPPNGGPLFGGPLQPEGRPGQQHPQYGSGGGMGPALGGSTVSNGPPGPAVPTGPSGSVQGQQPILNDALSYLDQVKVQFHEQPDVYNRFLDIMKDFKSQTIDTPGVISRVSDLFAGHPNLIQGFNTFLPPGYRIECGLENNPNSIRVTTPSGSTIHSISASRSLPQEAHPPPPGSGGMFLGPRPWPQQQQPPPQQAQQNAETMEGQFGNQPPNAPSGPGVYGHAGPVGSMYDNVSRSGHSVGPGGPGNPGTMAPIPPVQRTGHTPGPGGSVNGNASQQAGGEKRGPVEFNHAISYVNKIKNRFQDKPEIYKQFLEILQTYQREQKPIQEVYAQVTTLFSGAPDLLEDFKQFLPESAAHARPTVGRSIEEHSNNSMGSAPLGSSINNGNASNNANTIAPFPQGTPPSQTVREGPKMPPVGNFAPPSSAMKESKKRPRQEKQVPAPAPVPTDLIPSLSSVRGPPPATVANKRAKVSHAKMTAESTLAVEPTLTPVMPEPLVPLSTLRDTQEGLNFFERVKKYLSNRTAMNEFLKLINLYRQGLIQLNVLVVKSHSFIGGNSELFNWFKSHLGYTGEDEIIENRPSPPSGKVSLSNCRGYGPSYRLLPRRERLKRCSGRDELCYSVLNDEWASHPTWASEDSGFVAHRKNGYEEGLHRIEEERHDYDFYIEANQKFIQLLEPLAQQMLTLAPHERDNFRMPPGLGGQSTSIYKRVLKKVYGLEKGAEVANDMFSHPFAAVPVIMARLKQKDEEWRFSQREWEKVWMAQTEAMHLKSLDHMGIQVKSSDKRHLSAKHLVDVIKTKREEQRRAVALGNKAPAHQFQWDFSDRDIILDLLRFMLLYVLYSGQHGAAEKERITDFFETFIPQFFDLPEEQVQQRLSDIDRDSGDEDGDDATPAELTNGRSRRSTKKSDLLRGVLDPGRNGSKSRNQKEGSAPTTGSKETTPDIGSANEEEMPDAPEDAATSDQPSDRWLPTVPRPTVLSGDDPLKDGGSELKADGMFKRQWYNFFCNQTVYVFFSVFHALYQRLKDVKESTSSVVEQLERENAEKPGRALGMIPEPIAYFDANRPESFWPRTVELIEDFLTGEIEENRYFDVLRHYYLKKGWTLYTIQDLLKTLCRQALVCSGSDTREKTPDLVHQFLVSRHQDETSYQTEISARKFAEKCIKDGEMFQITWYPTKNEAAIRWLQRDEPTFNVDEMKLQERWQYYISSYMRIEPTEGINRARLQKSVLTRSLPVTTDADSENGDGRKALAFNEGLVLRICLNSYTIVYEKGTSEYFIYNHGDDAAEDGSNEEAEEEVGVRSRTRKKSSKERDVRVKGEDDGENQATSKTSKGAEDSDSSARGKARNKASKLEEAREKCVAKKEMIHRRREWRKQQFREKFVVNNAWMKDQTQEEVQRRTDTFFRWVESGALPEETGSTAVLGARNGTGNATANMPAEDIGSKADMDAE